MIQAWQDASYFMHIWHFACGLGAEKHYMRNKNITVAHGVHVLIVKLLPLLHILPLLQNNGVTFDLIFVDRRCEISMLFYQPRKFAARFCGFIESSIRHTISSICSRCLKGLNPMNTGKQGWAKVGFWYYTTPSGKTSCHFDWSNMMWKTKLSPF